MKSVHLSEEQLDDILLGYASPAVMAHHEGCVECEARVDEVQSAIRSFNAVTMSWSDRRSATMQPQPVIAGPAWNRRLNWAMAAGLVAVTAITLPLTTRTSPSANVATKNDAHETTQQVQVPQVAVNPTLSPVVQMIPVKNDVVEHDNRMLQAIDVELDAAVDSPAQTFGVDTRQGGGTQRRGLPEAISD